MACNSVLVSYRLEKVGFSGEGFSKTDGCVKLECLISKPCLQIPFDTFGILLNSGYHKTAAYPTECRMLLRRWSWLSWGMVSVLTASTQL